MRKFFILLALPFLVACSDDMDFEEETHLDLTKKLE